MYVVLPPTRFSFLACHPPLLFFLSHPSILLPHLSSLSSSPSLSSTPDLLLLHRHTLLTFFKTHSIVARLTGAQSSIEPRPVGTRWGIVVVPRSRPHPHSDPSRPESQRLRSHAPGLHHHARRLAETSSRLFDSSSIIHRRQGRPSLLSSPHLPPSLLLPPSLSPHSFVHASSPHPPHRLPGQHPQADRRCGISTSSHQATHALRSIPRKHLPVADWSVGSCHEPAC